MYIIGCTTTATAYGGFAGGVHLFPFRTEKLSPPWPMVLALRRESR